ncbi:MAG: single-stranded DNA-binding protein [Myxococcota bacterium]|nr:single-stranded DNA-binding protein [Myxococcota bacterium]MDW8362560.1 single-stranded DNA-binding protein [Myxococcales bacterium]
MADGLNRVFLLGNLGQDPEMRYTPSQQALMRLRIATNESYLDRNRQRQQRTEWHTVVVWGARAEALQRYLHKGQQVFVEGRLQTRQWEDRDGNKRTTTEVIAINIWPVGAGRRESLADADAARRADRDEVPADYVPVDEFAAEPGRDPGTDDDVPF